MIITKEVNIKITKNLTSEYIENELKNISIEPLRWAIVNVNDEFYTLTVSYEI